MNKEIIIPFLLVAVLLLFIQVCDGKYTINISSSVFFHFATSILCEVLDLCFTPQHQFMKSFR